MNLSSISVSSQIAGETPIERTAPNSAAAKTAPNQARSLSCGGAPVGVGPPAARSVRSAVIARP